MCTKYGFFEWFLSIAGIIGMLSSLVQGHGLGFLVSALIVCTAYLSARINWLQSWDGCDCDDLPCDYESDDCCRGNCQCEVDDPKPIKRARKKK